MPSWDAALYLQFAAERAQPALDLIARINLAQPRRVIDLGCGPGNSTTMLRHRWPDADISGLDNSPAMIAAATQSFPTGKWLLADAATWTADIACDLVFSNAALQWLPDHATLLPHLLAQVASGGALAVQMPANSQSPLRQVAAEVANDLTWRHRMEAALAALSTEKPTFYYNRHYRE